ncbi:MAG: putative metal-binding motif-containing protein [Pseudomonadota bacterium]|nr:putative metal-binding motif-containing protein [Pseudomonadota bacterium]
MLLSFLSLLIAAAHAQCMADPYVQDLNCNGVDVVDEVPVDLTDPECSGSVNGAGIPYPNADYYYDYVSYGCRVPVTALDDDHDGLSAGEIYLMPDETFPDLILTLTCDNCSELWNRDQADADCDNVGDPCDVCPVVYDPLQEDADLDGLGDACDVCPYVPDVPQEDFDADGYGDACDNCPDVVNSQEDEDEDGVGDACDVCWKVVDPDQADIDLDGLGDLCDTCPADYDPEQRDADNDDVGDACDLCPNLDGDQADEDRDGVGDKCDICVYEPDTEQLDSDFDGLGDACDLCPENFDPDKRDIDADGFGDACDDCPAVYDPDQLDADDDGQGDACQPCLGAGWDPGECADYAARGGASTCSTSGAGLPGLLAIVAAAWMTRRRRGRGAVVTSLVLLAGCGFIPASEREWRLDPDGDGVEWPYDCDDDDASVVGGPPWFIDGDLDGYGAGASIASCETPGEGYVRSGEDCDDANFNIHPGAPEACDGRDQDCDGTLDEGFALYQVYTDLDGDGYGGIDAGEACAVTGETAANDGDCDDTVATIHPHADEICDGLDDDCDGLIDEALLAIWWYDADDDGFGDPLTGIETCAPEADYVARGEDCDDTDEHTRPGGREVCEDGRDNDCNGTIDDEFTRWTDLDGDGFGDPLTTRTACRAEDDEVDNNVDCDDTLPLVNPAVPETCDDGIDNDCDQVIDTCEGQ